MTVTQEPMSFIKCLTHVFKRPEQSAGQFMIEIKALSPEDRKWYREELTKAGYVIQDAV